ncbi:PadR family transcriptional regulator [Clostridium sp. chh4-2]|uniref:PadR family transcriptional regulator n=1 Tax=Clostridium sp. chh4-2 TaxID=2067550 RepID=UPI000CCDD1CA|nr:PadR family transcriptional regulator [Clostridium sp. chh4-2]PNV60693.1 PadR family transcriptional regulator [Clostridium sp. chh4-2]
MRTLKYAILGLINREPMTGYDITREFNSNNLANFWYAKHSQVYPELSRLMEEELVTCQVVIQGEKLEKKLYTITEKGRKELLEWLMEDDPLGPTPKDVFRLRLYFSDFMTPEQLKNHLQEQIKKHTSKRQYLSDIMEQNHQNTPPPAGTKECGDFMVLEGAIIRETSYIQWLRNCLKRM